MAVGRCRRHCGRNLTDSARRAMAIVLLAPVRAGCRFIVVLGWRPTFRTDRLSTMIRPLCVALAVAVSAVVAAADQQPTFRSGVRTVPVYATAFDGSGRLVPDLEQEDFEVLDNGKPVTIASSKRAAAVHRGGDARHQRQHDRPPRAPQPGRRAVPAAPAAGGPGAGRRVQRQDQVRPASSSTTATLIDALKTTWSSATRRGCGTRVDLSLDRAPGRGRPPRRAGVHRRRRHRQQGALRHRPGSGPRRGGHGLRDRPVGELLQRRPAGLVARPIGRCGGSPRRPAAATSSWRRPTTCRRPSPRWRRSCTASTCSGFVAREPRRQGAQARGPREAAGRHRAGAPILFRRSRQRQLGAALTPVRANAWNETTFRGSCQA